MLITVVTITTSATSRVINAICRARTPSRGSGETLEETLALAPSRSCCALGVSAVAVAMMKW
jgi:hypothetical protein